MSQHKIAHKVVITNPLPIGYNTRDVYNMNEIGLSCPTKQDTSAKEKLVGANLKGSSYSCSWCKHDMHPQVETYDYSKISTAKMLWKVVANKLCVLVSKPNGMDDIICIWELDDEPRCTFQISRA